MTSKRSGSDELQDLFDEMRITGKKSVLDYEPGEYERLQEYERFREAVEKRERSQRNTELFWKVVLVIFALVVLSGLLDPHALQEAFQEPWW